MCEPQRAASLDQYKDNLKNSDAFREGLGCKMSLRGFKEDVHREEDERPGLLGRFSPVLFFSPILLFSAFRSLVIWISGFPAVGSFSAITSRTTLLVFHGTTPHSQ